MVSPVVGRSMLLSFYFNHKIWKYKEKPILPDKNKWDGRESLEFLGIILNWYLSVAALFPPCWNELKYQPFKE